MPEFNARDIVYDSRGNEYEYISSVAFGDDEVVHMVYPLIEISNYDEQPYTERGEATTRNVLYATPPVQKRAEEVILLENRIAELNRGLAALKDDIKLYDAKQAELKEKMSHIDALSRIDQFLNGGITHYAKISKDNCMEVKCAFKSDSYSNKGGLLSLYPFEHIKNGKRSVVWKVNSYADGSGFDTQVIPCLSEQEAIARIKAEIELRWGLVNFSDESAGNVASVNQLATTSTKFGVEHPAKYIEMVNNLNLKALTKRLADAENATQLLRAARDKFMSDLSSVAENK